MRELTDIEKEFFERELTLEKLPGEVLITDELKEEVKEELSKLCVQTADVYLDPVLRSQDG